MFQLQFDGGVPGKVEDLGEVAAESDGDSGGGSDCSEEVGGSISLGTKRKLSQT